MEPTIAPALLLPFAGKPPDVGALVPKGTLLAVDDDIFATVVIPEIKEKCCEFCFAKSKDELLYLCVHCEKVYYCGFECQTQAWSSYHGVECPFLKQLPRNSKWLQNPNYLMTLRVLTRLKSVNRGKGPEVVIGNTCKRSFRDLRGPLSKDDCDGRVAKMRSDLIPRRKGQASSSSQISVDLVVPEKFEVSTTMLKEILENPFAEGFEVNDLVSLYTKTVINMFEFRDTKKAEVVGFGISLVCLIPQHSCKGNVVIDRIKRTFYLRAIEDIQAFDWNNVFMNYAGDLALKCRAQRQSHLWANHAIRCACVVCQSSQHDDDLRSITCQKCHIGNVPMTGDTLFPTEHSEASSCSLCGSSEVSIVAQNMFLEALDVTKEFVRKMQIQFKCLWLYDDLLRIRKLGKQISKESDKLEQVESLWSTQEECFVHPYNYLRFAVATVGYNAFKEAKDFVKALRYGEVMIQALRYYYADQHVVLVEELLGLCRVAFLASNRKAAVVYALEALEKCAIGVGEFHPYFDKYIAVETMYIRRMIARQVEKDQAAKRKFFASLKKDAGYLVLAQGKGVSNLRGFLRLLPK